MDPRTYRQAAAEYVVQALHHWGFESEQHTAAGGEIRISFEMKLDGEPVQVNLTLDDIIKQRGTTT